MDRSIERVGRFINLMQDYTAGALLILLSASARASLVAPDARSLLRTGLATPRNERQYERTVRESSEPSCAEVRRAHGLVFVGTQRTNDSSSAALVNGSRSLAADCLAAFGAAPDKNLL